MSDGIDTSPAAIAAIVARERHRRFPYQPAGRECANVIDTLAAERDRLADENARMRDALRKLSTAMPRIDIDPLDFLREFVRPTARAALKGDGDD